MPADLIEVTLLLIWRHLNHYLDESRQQSFYSPGRPNADALSSGYKAQPLRSNLDLGNIRQNAQDAFSLALESLQNIHLVG